MALVAAGLLVTTTACGGGAGGGETDAVQVGAILPLTGAGAGLGIPTRQGIDLAVEEINENGGIAGRQVELIVQDDGSSTEMAAAAADRLVSDGVKVLLGSGLTANSDAIAASTGGEIPQIAFTGLGPEVELTYEHMYHAMPPQAMNARAMLEYAANALAAKRIGVLHDSGYGQVVMEAVEQLAPEYGIELVAVEEGDVAATDVTTQAAKVRAASPDAVFIVSTNAVYFRNASEAGIDVPRIAALGSATYEYANAMGAAGNGLVTPEFVVGEEPLPHQQDFVDAYREKYDALPKNFDTAGYDAVYMVKRAIEEAGADASPDEIGQAMRAPYEGVMATYNFGAEDKTGIGLESYVYSELNDGAFTRLEFRPGGD